ncbi:type II secretion system protein [Desulfovulcanus sp.]
MTKLKSKALSQEAKGFTLIEMAIVLVVIGLILAAVMKGKDMIRSTQAKEFTEGFVYKWVNMMQSFKDKTGHVFTDSVLYGGLNATTDGLMDGVQPELSGETLTNGVQGNTLVSVLKKTGIDPCRMIKTDIQSNSTSTIDFCNGLNIFSRTVKGENIISTTTVNFVHGNFSFADGSVANNKNALIFKTIPNDVARAIDKQLDGREDGRMGVCVYAENLDVDNTNGSTAAWPDSTSSGGTTNVVVILEQ